MRTSDQTIQAVTVRKSWLAQRLGNGAPQSSMRLYFELLDAVMAGAVTDKVEA